MPFLQRQKNNWLQLLTLGGFCVLFLSGCLKSSEAFLPCADDTATVMPSPSPQRRPPRLQPASNTLGASLVTLIERLRLAELITIKSSTDVDNAAALIHEQNGRLILYNPDFMECNETRAFCTTFEYFVLGHEIGHHLEGHTVLILGGKEQISASSERSADATAARLLRETGITESNLKGGLEIFAKKIGNSEKTKQRIARIIEVFNNTPDRDGEINQLKESLFTQKTNLSTTKAELTTTKELLKLKEDELQNERLETEARTSWSEQYARSNPGTTNGNYVIESASMVVNIADQGIDFSLQSALSAEATMVYTIRALRDFTGQFDEEYHSQTAKVTWLPPSDPHVVHESLQHQVQANFPLKMKRGERKTITTRARFDYTLPFASTRTTHGFTLAPHEDAWCYPNFNDTIDELTITISSRQQIAPPTQTDAHMLDAQNNVIIAAAPLLQNSGGVSTVSYRWTKIHPVQTMAVKISRATLTQ